MGFVVWRGKPGRKRVCKLKVELACKPGSVVNSHSSGLQVTLQLKQSTQKQHGPCRCFSI